MMAQQKMMVQQQKEANQNQPNDDKKCEYTNINSKTLKEKLHLWHSIIELKLKKF